jgi:CDGSH-type Zn-finger protein/truncated hemoglobin YjbI
MLDASISPVSDHTTPTHDDLIGLIARASDEEHGLACTLLYAAASLKNDASEGGLTDGQVDVVRGWKRRLLLAARDHLRRVASLANLTAALGGTPRLARRASPASPAPTAVGAVGQDQTSPALAPFSPAIIDRLAAGELVAARPGDIATTLADLYAAIAAAVGAPHAEGLVVGPAGAQVTERTLDLGGSLVAVTDRASALAALDALTGADAEPAPGAAAMIGAEYAAALADAQKAGAPFEPVRPITVNPTLRLRGDAAGGGDARIVDPSTRAVAALFVDAYDTFLLVLRQILAPASTDAPAADRDILGRIAPRLLDAVIRPLSDALARMPFDEASPHDLCAGPPFGDVAGDDTPLPATAALMEIDGRLWRLTTTATTLCAAPAAPILPSEVREATAALQDLSCGLAPTDGPNGATARLAALREAQSGLACAIQASVNGPYLATNADTLTTWLGEAIPTRPQLALCRCGQSRLKPFCDGTHARVDFTGRKDPARVPDRRDAYPGTQMTILDNRGTCAHSGFCTDRLKAVFHLGEDPFVVPNGVRMDDIVRAVRACPSGALSYALEGVEIRDGVDQRRPPAIEVSKDGPYRITGGIPLYDGQGDDEPRNAGASREHYSLCRCGHSRNKPFCSGMHWYVDFHDPEAPADHQPTLFEWAGGLPALNRMTRLFYGKYVPQDPLLEPLFAHMSPDHPERVAAWLSEVFGGPAAYSERYGGGTSQGGYRRMVSEHIGAGLTEEQRARWASLMARSAGEAGLPADPEFRAAFAAYIEWGSRLAVENSTPGAHPPMNMPVPRWDWVCNATPWGRVSALASSPQEEKALALPTAGEPLHFEAHIKPLFRQTDRQSMVWAFDLWAYKDVSAHAPAILDRLRAGTMPCDGAWPGEKVDVFARWVAAGRPE